MSPAWGHLIGVVIVLLMLAFIGIWIWAWLPRHETIFSRLAQIPMEDPAAPEGRSGGTRHQDQPR